MTFFDLASQNLLSPMVLFFALGLGAALGRSDLSIPEAVAKTLALYLMMAIGFKGGAGVAASGISPRMLLTMGAGALLSFVLPLIGYLLLRTISKIPAVDAAAIAAHYGSISIVTFVAAVEAVKAQGLSHEGYLVAVAAIMETPAILSALLIARRAGASGNSEGLSELVREVGLNASVVMLVGAFFIGWITGERGLAMIAPFIIDPFRGILCLFLLDMGLVAGRGMREGRKALTAPVLAFGLIMPLLSAALACLLIAPIGLSHGGTALFLTLAASASYIAVPAAMRLALPEARPALYLTLSLGVTFPFNLTFGIPLYLLIAGKII
jgi:uncharacterized protein